MTLVTAPDGAILALLAIATSAPIVPDETAEIWLREQALIDDTTGGITEITGRGRAWLRMLNTTPLPVKIERWDDPRAPDAPPAPPAKSDAQTLLEGLAALLQRAPAPTPGNLQVTGLPFTTQPSAAAPARPAPLGTKPAQVVTTIPPGYRETPVEWSTIPVGQWPAALRPDADVKVIYRDGRVSAPRAAQSIIWQHKGTNDDVIAFTELGNDTIVTVNSAPIN